MREKNNQLLTVFFVSLFVITVVRNAWITDDAYISFRAIENLVAGYGFNFNPFVRVQVYTHPLWALLVSIIYFIQINILGLHRDNGLHFLVIFLSILISTLAVYMAFHKTTKKPFFSKLLLGVAIISSQAFIDYSTSGLETPLTYLLLAIFFFIFLKKDDHFLALSISAAFLTVNRQDTILLVFPALMYSFVVNPKSWKIKLYEVILGFLPLILWEFFSLFYYGFLFPNTAYAKLNTGIPKLLLVLQGFDYFLNSIAFDPITLLMIILAGGAVFIEKEKKAIFSYVGILLYLVYVLSVGGDFMAGRFFAPPFFLAVILLSRASFLSKRIFILLIASILVFTTYLEYSPLKSSSAKNIAEQNILENAGQEWLIGAFIGKNGIANEKEYYTHFSGAGLTEYGIRQSGGGSIYAGKNWKYTGTKEVMVSGSIGFTAYQQGPNIYMLDREALTDPLLARLPTENTLDWRVGHFTRSIPIGYLDSLKTNEPKIKNPDLAYYYEQLSQIITGPLWSKERFIEIWKFNTGQYDYLIENYLETTTN